MNTPVIVHDEVHVKKEPTLLSNVLAIIGFLIILFIIVWGLLHIIALIRGTADPISFGNWNPTTSSGLQIQAPTDATAGAVITIAWTYKPTVSGTYTFTYACADGAGFQAVIPQQSNVALPCATGIIASTTSNSVAVMPTLTGSNITSVPITISFTPVGGGAAVTGTATIAIHPGNTVTPVATSTPSENPTQTPATTTQPTQPRSPADISVTIVGVGIIDPGTGAFIPVTPGSLDDTVAVKFDIKNIGGTPTGAYTFEADLPTINGYHYVSPIQKSLGAGDHVLNTLRFTQVASGGGTFTVVADPNQTVNEATFSNNTASVGVNAGNYQ
ncbi:MAG: hypothetical protein JWO50_182 [Candidatus Kaiserbacteria bacterium]|nr:hypothetical protein [Candidatus Kaiserbacteria bacterium]